MHGVLHLFLTYIFRLAGKKIAVIGDLPGENIVVELLFVINIVDGTLKLRPIPYDGMNHAYYVLGKKVGNAFSDGAALK